MIDFSLGAEQNFAGVNTICAYLRARQPATQEAAHE